MCKVFAGQDPAGYRQVNRSVRIGGHSTSIQLEATFWELLDEIARSEGLTTPKFLSKLYDEALEIHGSGAQLRLDAQDDLRALSARPPAGSQEVAELSERAA